MHVYIDTQRECTLDLITLYLITLDVMLTPATKNLC